MKLRIFVVVAALSLLFSAGIASANSKGVEREGDTRFNFGYDAQTRLFLFNTQATDSSPYDCTLQNGSLTATYGDSDGGGVIPVEGLQDSDSNIITFEPTEFDLDKILHAARETGTALEINASPERLDLKDTHAYRARELGVPLVINTDSHDHTHLDKKRYGVAVARRAWCQPQDILNTFTREQFLEFIRTPKPDRIKVFDAAHTSLPSGGRP